LSILRVTDHHHRDANGVLQPIDRFLLIVTDLIIAPKIEGDRYLPYPLLKYDVVHVVALRLSHRHVPQLNSVHMYIIDAESIFRPAILIPCPDRSKNYGKAFSTNRLARPSDQCTASVRLWGIPYKTLDRSGYDMTFPVQQQQQQGAPRGVNENIFINDVNINEIYEEARAFVDHRAGDDDDDDDAEDD
jgi:hypothetical protein